MRQQQQEQPQFTMEELIESIVNLPEDKFDISLTLEIADRANNNYKELREGIQCLMLHFQNSDSTIILQAVRVLEIFVKNCNERFHREVSNKDFQNQLMKLLKFRRKKANIFEKMTCKEKNWNQIEDKVLYIIQLWADTFMMHEDEFPYIMQNYKELRKEGLKFPPRDTTEKFMIQFKGQKSPLFDVLEDVSKREQEQEQKRKRLEQLKSSKLDLSQKSNKDVFSQSNKIYNNILNEDKPVDVTVNQQDVDSQQENLQILVAIMENAQNINDLHTEYVEELLKCIKKSKSLFSQAMEDSQTLTQLQIESLEKLNNKTGQILKSLDQKKSELKQLTKVMEETYAVEAKKQESELKEKHTTEQLKKFKIQPPGANQQPSQAKQEQVVENLLDIDDTQEKASNSKPATASQDQPKEEEAKANQVTENLLDFNFDATPFQNPKQETVQAKPQEPQTTAQVQNNQAQDPVDEFFSQIANKKIE